MAQTELRFHLWRACLAGLTALLGLPAAIPAQAAEPFIVILGVAQDGGYPQAGCTRDCCAPAWDDWNERRFSSCIAVVDPDSGQRWMLDCTPDFRDQLRLLDTLAPRTGPGSPLSGILLTHAHVGHYSGLLHLGREVMGAQAIEVFAMPRMKAFLEGNGPWSQLVSLQQIQIHRIAAGQSIRLNDRIRVVPFLVPHRDEFSETVGFKIEVAQTSVVYLPDIDKWQRWDVDIESVIRDCDLALLDGTFFDIRELPGRDLSQIPHPFISQSIKRFEGLSAADRNKIQFIHLNHSNPGLRPGTEARSAINASGSHVAEQGSIWKFTSGEAG